LIGYQTPPASKPIALSSVLPALPYLLVQLGGPFSGDHEGLAAIIGLTGLVLFAAFGLRTLKAGNTTEKALAAICAFVLAQLAVTALGRVNVESAMTSRYTSAPLLFWLSIALWASAGTAKRPIRSASVMGLMVSVLAFVAITEGPFAKEATNWAAIRKLAIPPVLANVPDNDLLKQVYPNPGIPLKFRSDIVAAKTMMFAEEWTRWLGTRLSDHVSIEDSPDCGASFTNAFPVPGINGDAWRATGRTWRNERGSAPTRIILTDDDGRIVGYGVGGFAASSINEKPIPDSLWWFGDFKAEDPEKAIAYVFEPIRSTACKIGTHGKTPT
jgi:hypothetical protein